MTCGDRSAPSGLKIESFLLSPCQVVDHSQSSPGKTYSRKDSGHCMENMITQETERNCVAPDGAEGPLKKKTKKEKRRENEDAASTGTLMEPFSDGSQRSPKKKEKKKEKENRNEVHSSQRSPKKKEKKKEKENRNEVHGFTSSGGVADDLNSSPKKRKREEKSEAAVSDELQMSPKKKKKLKGKEGEDGVAFCSEIPVEPLLDGVTGSGSPKKKKKKENVTVGGEVFCSEIPMELQSDVGTCSDSSKKKKKKKKIVEDGEGLCSEIPTEPRLLDSTLNSSPKKKKMKKKKKRKDEENREVICSEIPSERLVVAMFSRSSEKKKKTKDVENGEAISSEIPSEPLLVDSTFNSSPEKKKKREDVEVGEVLCSDIPTEPLWSEISRSPKKKKKMKKEKRKETCASEDVLLDTSLASESISSSPKKKRKKERTGDVSILEDAPLSVSSVGSQSRELAVSPRKKKKKKEKDKAEENYESEDLFSVHGGSGTDGEDKKNPPRRRFDPDGAAPEPTSSLSAPKKHSHSERITCEVSDASGGPPESSASPEAQHDRNSGSRHREKADRKSCESSKHLGDKDTSTATSCKRAEYANDPTTNPGGESDRVTSEASHERAEDAVSPSATSPGGKNNSVMSCYICQKKMSSKKLYIQHLAEQHKKKSYHCPKCMKALSSELLVQRHLDICCPLKGSKDYKTLSYHCTRCPLSYSSKPSLVRHLRTEHKLGVAIQPKCNRCGQTFTTTVRAREHRKKCEEGLLIRPHEQDFQCPLCDQLFSSGPGRRYHVRTIHLNQVFDCVCGKEFRGSTNYYSHRKTCKEVQSVPRLREET